MEGEQVLTDGPSASMEELPGEAAARAAIAEVERYLASLDRPLDAITELQAASAKRKMDGSLQSFHDELRLLMSPYKGDTMDVQGIHQYVLGIQAAGQLEGVYDRTDDREQRCKGLRDTPVPSAVSAQLREHLGALLFSQPEDVRSRLLDFAEKNIDLCLCKMRGPKFLRKLFDLCHAVYKAGLPAGKVMEVMAEDVDSLFALSLDVGERAGQQYRYIPYALHTLMDGDIDAVRALIAAQCAASKGNAVPFFEHFLRFLGTYADVSQHLRREERRREGRLQILAQYLGYASQTGKQSMEIDDRTIDESLRYESVRERSQNCLSTILKDGRLLTHPVSADSVPNLFTLLQERLSTQNSDERNPWVLRNLSSTPFDARKVGQLVSSEMPRQVLGTVLCSLNQYSTHILFDRARSFIQRFEQHQEDDADVDDLFRARGTKPDPGAYRSTDILESEINAFITELGLVDWTGPDSLSLSEKIEALRIFLPEDESHANINDPVPIDQEGQPEGHVVPSHAFLRLLDSHRIVHDRTAQEAFTYFMDELAEGMTSYPAAARTPVLARSLFEALRTTETSFELPLEFCKGTPYYRRSLRDILTKFAIVYLDDETLCEGPLKYGQGMQERMGKTLIPPLDARELDQSPDTLKRNFNTAMIGSERRGLLRLAERLNRSEGGPDPYKWAMSFATRECAKGLNAQGHEFHFHPSAHQAFQTFVQQCFPSLTPQQNIIISGQEYQAVTDSVVRRDGVPGFAKPRILPLENDAGQSKTKEQLLADALLLIDDDTQMFVLSSLTRFGDMPCPHPGNSRENLVWFLQQLALRHPQLTIVIDGAQALGRLRLPSLRDFPPNALFLGSGSKALGVGSVGFLAASYAFMKHHPRARHYEYNPSTLPTANVTALGLAFRRERAKYNMWRPEKNADRAGIEAGESGRKDASRLRFPMHIARAKRMSSLTRHAVGRAQRYGQEFIRKHKVRPSSHPSLNEKKPMERAEQFGCRIYAPHQYEAGDAEEKEYGGILTIYFPNVSAASLEPLLMAHGFQTSCVRRDREALRISFHYLHTKEDIDALFEAIQEAHGILYTASLASDKDLRNRLDRL